MSTDLQTRLAESLIEGLKQEDMDYDQSRRIQGWEPVENADGVNCGTGAGGFQPGNTCAKGGSTNSIHDTNRIKLAEHILEGTGKTVDVDDIMSMDEDIRIKFKQRISDTITKVLDTIPNSIPKGDRKALVSQVVKQWAYSSGDHEEASLATQLVAEEIFGYVGYKSSEFFDQLIGDNPDAETYYADNQHLIKPILQAIYKHTQDELRSIGIGPEDEVVLYRGMGISQENEAKFNHLHFKVSPNPNSFIPSSDYDQEDTITSMPLSSWSFDPEIARVFSYGLDKRLVLRSKVKAKDIFSTARTGLGCLVEGEVVVLGRGIGKADIAAYKWQ